MITLDTTSKKTLQEQIGNEFKKMILMEAFKEGEKVPSVRELACTLILSPNTVSKAYKELELEGIFTTVKGKGTYIKKGSKKILLEKLRGDFKNKVKTLVIEGKKYKVSSDEIISMVNEFYYELGEI